jgi:hypothetical protein
MKGLFYALLLICSLKSIAQQTTLPTDLAWNNAVVNFNCVPNGTTDNTINLRRAAQTYPNQFSSNLVVYLPKGTYLISDSIEFPSTFFDKDITFIGEDSALTIIKLIDNAPNFQNASNPRPLIKTRSGNQAFGNYFKNLTINTGNNNPGAIGVDYISSNYGAIEGVKIVSPDASAYCGIIMDRQWPGPALIKNVTVDGFKYGIRVNTCEYSMTFEQVNIKNSSITGLFNLCNTLAIRKLFTQNCAKAIVNSGGRITLLDSRFENSANTNYAIENINDSKLFCRNITSTGYAGALVNNSIPIPGSSLAEYYVGTNYSLFPNDGKSLNLPVEETPTYINNNLSEWAKANSFGAEPSNPNFSIINAAPGLQAALNSGKKIIYFDRVGDNGSAYLINNDVTIPASVELIQGFQHARFGTINNSKFVINENGPPLIIDGFRTIDILNNSARTVVFKGQSLGKYTNTAANTNGKVFLEDLGAPFVPQFPVKMWARQFNPEIQPELDTAIINRGGDFWILGLKTEGRACIASTVNNGKTEILGALVYPASSFSGTNQVAFNVDNACMSITTLTRTSYIGNGWFGVSVKETQNGTTLNLNTPGIPSFYDIPFYSTSKLNCDRAVLPLNITALNLVCNKNYYTLKWKTSYEFNLQNFVIQESADGLNWNDKKTIVPNNLASAYEASVLKNNDVNFIRLVSIEKDGKQTFSAINKLNCMDNNQFMAFPNPFKENIEVRLKQNMGAVTYALLDATGKYVLQKSVVQNSNNILINTAQLPKGVYILKIVCNNNKAYFEKVVKQ